jgi:hypothetical protein
MLFEVMLSVALFVGAAAFCLGATRSVFGALDRAKRQQEAVDLARSKLAELEAGLITLGDLRDEWSGAVGSFESDEELDAPGRRPRWSFDVKTSRTEFRGLTLVELTVAEPPELEGDRLSAETTNPSVTLRQLVALRAEDVEAYEVDELLEGLPEVEP